MLQINPTMKKKKFIEQPSMWENFSVKAGLKTENILTELYIEVLKILGIKMF